MSHARKVDARLSSGTPSHRQGRPRHLPDTALPSFGLMVTKNGARSFVYQYRCAKAGG